MALPQCLYSTVLSVHHILLSTTSCPSYPPVHHAVCPPCPLSIMSFCPSITSSVHRVLLLSCPSVYHIFLSIASFCPSHSSVHQSRPPVRHVLLSIMSSVHHVLLSVTSFCPSITSFCLSHPSFLLCSLDLFCSISLLFSE